jgi:hypothetical protein
MLQVFLSLAIVGSFCNLALPSALLLLLLLLLMMMMMMCCNCTVPHRDLVHCAWCS